MDDGCLAARHRHAVAQRSTSPRRYTETTDGMLRSWLVGGEIDSAGTPSGRTLAGTVAAAWATTLLRFDATAVRAGSLKVDAILRALSCRGYERAAG